LRAQAGDEEESGARTTSSAIAASDRRRPRGQIEAAMETAKTQENTEWRMMDAEFVQHSQFAIQHC
jgi:hypothetical protein